RAFSGDQINVQLIDKRIRINLFDSKPGSLFFIAVYIDDVTVFKLTVVIGLLESVVVGAGKRFSIYGCVVQSFFAVACPGYFFDDVKVLSVGTSFNREEVVILFHGRDPL